MRYLYHGSKFQQNELKPGLQHSGELTEWDKTESNAYLYATNDKQEAIRQGIASTLEKEFDVSRFEITPAHFDIFYPPAAKRQPTANEVEKLVIYLYTIERSDHDGWQEVNNPHNGLKGKEYKTVRTLKNQITQCETIMVKDWLEQHRIQLTVAVDTTTPSNGSRVNDWLTW